MRKELQDSNIISKTEVQSSNAIQNQNQKMDVCISTNDKEQ